jgi:hypothetical protein
MVLPLFFILESRSRAAGVLILPINFATIRHEIKGKNDFDEEGTPESLDF